MTRFFQFSFLLFFSFYFSQTYFNGKKVNTDPLNKKYRESRKFFYGQLTNHEYLDKKSRIEKELGVIILEGKSIFITYKQSATNCSLVNRKEIESYYKLNTKIGNKISLQNNADIFYLYNNDLFPDLLKLIQNNENYRVDSGFFSQNIFTLKENCEAFYILKPNGNYMICYGTDSFSYASDFLKSNKIKK